MLNISNLNRHCRTMLTISLLAGLIAGTLITARLVAEAARHNDNALVMLLPAGVQNADGFSPSPRKLLPRTGSGSAALMWMCKTPLLRPLILACRYHQLIYLRCIWLKTDIPASCWMAGPSPTARMSRFVCLCLAIYSRLWHIDSSEFAVNHIRISIFPFLTGCLNNCQISVFR